MQVLRMFATPQVRSHSASRLLHTTRVASVDYKWRRTNNLPRHVRQEPELYDRPDFSFLDGRPTPLGKLLKNRYEDEQRIAKDAIKYIAQIDYAVARQERLMSEAEENARARLSRKLKPKGPAYKAKYSKEQEQ